MTDNKSLPEELVYGAYAGDVPCVFELTDAGCDVKAKFLLRLTHAHDDTQMCSSPEQAPFCPGHKDMMERSLKGFWADLQPTLCVVCGERVQIAGVTEL